jgi:uncharacterized protein YndB with AHSA1/START domain
MNPDDSVLRVRRSIHIDAARSRVWDEFSSFERMNLWWGIVLGVPDAGKPQGMRLVVYEPRKGGRAEMEVMMDGKPARFGGPIVSFIPQSELTIENDWIPNQGWKRPTYFTLRLSDALGGTLVELFHHGFERTGEGASDEHAGYEQGWGMTQLDALRSLIKVEKAA